MMETETNRKATPQANRYRPLHSTATFLQLLFGLFIVAAVVVVITGWAYRATLLDVVAGRSGSLADTLQREENYIAASGLLAGVNVVLVAAFVSWFWRAYSNLRALGRTTRRKPGWAIFSWVIPIGNFFIPYQMGSEIWRKSAPNDPESGVSADQNIEPVISWWALFLLMGLVNQIAFFSGRDVGDNAERLAAVVGVDLVGGLVAIAAAVAAFRFVRLATARQEAPTDMAGSPIAGPIR